MVKSTSLILFSLLVSITIAKAETIFEINERLPTLGSGTALISGPTFTDVEVTYINKNGLAIFEGDILLGRVGSEVATGAAVVSQEIGNGIFRWPNNRIPYQFSANVSVGTQNTMLSAIDHWHQNTHIRFIERTAANAWKYPDYVNIVSNEAGCFSQVGRWGGEQNLNVFGLCSFGTMLHELGHTVGLYHEQARQDRDQFVQINFENIKLGKENQFNMYSSFLGNDFGPYDYGSIMHYDAFAFSSNGQPTITPLQPVTIGQRDGLSNLDIAAIIATYPIINPVAKLTKDTYSIYFGNTVNFDGRLSFDPKGTPLTYHWDVGDDKQLQTQTKTPTLNHLYATKGTYNVSLTVFDVDGVSNTDNAIAVVYGFEVMIPVLSMLI